MYRSVNPFNDELIKEYSFDCIPDTSILKLVQERWRKTKIEDRIERLNNLKELFTTHKNQIAKLITDEMGKPLREAEHEVEKCKTAIDYYSNNIHILKPSIRNSQAAYSAIHYEPLGIIVGIMPWNFPFWQVIRWCVPAILGGNTVILKHAPNVPGCASFLQRLFLQSGFEEGVFVNLFLKNEDVPVLLSDIRVAGLSFTGSDTTGSYLAAISGRELKKTVMELGGNDSFIVFEDADIDEVISAAIKSRTINGGQACNGAKRFIVPYSLHQIFINKLTLAVSTLKIGNPLLSATDIGPLARPDLAVKVRNQIEKTVQEGALAYYHPDVSLQKGNFVYPIVLSGVQKGMTAFEEEIFGPVFSVINYTTLDEAVKIANDSKYGLGCSLWTKNQSDALKWVSELEVGNVFINEIVKSDPIFPFGGVKKSGFGRELSEYGLLEFMNLKTVFVK